MRVLWIALLGLLFSTPVLADRGDYLLNSITLQLSAEQWVTSKTALVTAGVNAAVTDSALEKIQDDVLQKLAQVSNAGDWHITSYDRSLDKTGLEHLQIAAQARLPLTALANIRDRVKTVSKPGETFTIDDIQFTPSAAELRDANVNLRNDIYQQAKDEIARINKVNSDLKYYLHNIDFTANVMPMPMAPMAQNTSMMMQARVSGNNGNSFAVGDKLVLNATIVLGSLTEPAPVKNPHL